VQHDGNATALRHKTDRRTGEFAAGG